VRPQLVALLAEVPEAWVQVALSVADATPEHAQSHDTFWALLLPRLGWHLGEGKSLPLTGFRVKGATHLLSSGSESAAALRSPRLATFAHLAGLPSHAGPVLTAFRRLWRTQLPGVVKEPLWRLAYDGLPTLAHMHAHASGCPCGGGLSDRAHHFWECAAARGVRDAIAEGAAAAGRSLPALLRSHIWLGQCPEGLHQGVWDIVALVAVAAMDKGRKFMVLQHTFAQPASPAGPALGARGAQQARLAYWEMLQAFAAGGGLPRGRSPGGLLTSTHPYLCLDAPGATRVRVFQPPPGGPSSQPAHPP
jgi:hypothetical protein